MGPGRRLDKTFLDTGPPSFRIKSSKPDISSAVAVADEGLAVKVWSESIKCEGSPGAGCCGYALA